MEKTNGKINIGMVVLFVFLLTPFLSISGIKNTMGAGMFQIWQIIAICFLLLIFLVKHQQIKFNWALGLFCAYQFIILFSSAYNGVITIGIIAIVFTSIIVFMLLQTDAYYEIIGAVSVIVVLSLIINAFTMVQNRDVIGAEYFIGGKNSLGIFLIPGMFILIIRALEKKNKINKFTVLAIVLCVASVFLGASGTGVVVAVFTIIVLLLAIKFKPKKTVYLGVVLVIYALFLLFSERFFLTEYWFKITQFLGKDSTLTARTTIWRLAKELIADNWLIGAGRGVGISYVNTYGELQVMTEAHNFILEILLEGGVVALLLFGLLFFRMVARLNLEKPKDRVIFIALCILLINGLTESTINVFMVIMIISIACRYAGEKEKEKI